MVKKLTAWFISFAMMVTIVPNITEARGSDAPVTVTPAVRHLEEQLENNNIEKGKITILVGLDDTWMKANENLDAVPVSSRKDTSLVEKQTEYAKDARDVFIEQAEKADIKFNVTEEYDMAFTGLALKTNVTNARKIASLPSVKDVELSIEYKAPKLEKKQELSNYRPLDNSSNGMVNAQGAWSGPDINKSGYTGKGELIAIIDSGFDYKHPAFQKFDDSEMKYPDEKSISKVIKEKSLSPGMFCTTKVPFAYNYASNNTNVKEISTMSHGMHVAGIVAANGVLPDGKEIKGVAPDAQLAIMRVFSDSIWGGGTSSKIYNKAIDDAIKLGCDSINMSLGAPAGSKRNVDIQQTMALQNARDMGIVVAMAAGNDGFTGNGAVDGPDADNPDYGILSAPAVAPLSMAVASIENPKIATKGMIINKEPDKPIKFVPSNIGSLSTEYINVKDCGYGYDEEMKTPDEKGSYALMQRGERKGDQYKTFLDKVNIAQKYGYRGVIVYDNEDNAPLFQMETPGARLPSALISHKDGLHLLEILKVNPEDTKISFSEKYVYTNNPNGNKLSTFSSWGVTPEGDLKPDITAPGGEIFSTLNDGTYGSMSGTSMASPHVAAGLALVKKRIEVEFSNIVGEEKYKLTKNLLMSTAVPNLNSEKNAYTSPRQQGAGVMNVGGAVKTPVVFEGTNELCSVNLGNISGDTVTVEAKLHNYGNKAASYKVKGILNTDSVEGRKILLKPEHLANSEEQNITVSPESTENIIVTMNIPDVEALQGKMPNGFFLEGYIFAESTEGNPTISIPYVGFYGNFQGLNVIEPSIYDLVENGKRPYYYGKTKDGGIAYTHIGAVAENKQVVLGEEEDSTYEDPHFTKGKIAFSPNGDGNADTAKFFGTFLRNYSAFSMVVEDEKHNVVDEFNVPQDNGKKSFFMNPDFYNVPFANMMQTKEHWQWGGSTIKGSQVEDGKYILKVKAWREGATSNENPNIVEFPIIVDRVYPRVEEAAFSKDNETYEISKLVEEGSGIRTIFIKNGDKIIKPEIGADGKYTFNIKDIDLNNAVLKVSDYAYNISVIPMNNAVRTGNERSIRVTGRTSSGEAVPSEAFQWTVQNEAGDILDPYNLKPGKYILYINEVSDPTFRLAGNSEKIEFTIDENDKEKEVSVPFESVKVGKFTVIVTDQTNTPVSFSIVDTVTDKQFQLIKKDEFRYEAEVPEGVYKVIVNGVSEDIYAQFVNGNIAKISENTFFNPVSVRLGKKGTKNVTVKLKRKGYEGPIDICLIGKDTDHTEQNVHISAEKSETTVSLITIPSDIVGKNFEDPFYSVMKNSDWNCAGKSFTVKLVKNDKPDPKYVDKRELKAIIEEVSAIIDKLEQLYEPDGTTFRYIRLYINLLHTTFNNANASQADVDAVCRNMRTALDKLVKKGENGLSLKRINDLIAQAQGLKAEDYTEETWKNLQDNLTKAMAKVEKADTEKMEQYIIDDTADELKDAINNLVRKDGEALIDKTELKKAISDASGINEDEYTRDSWIPFEVALEIAKEIDKNNFPREEEISKAIENLNKAKEELKKIKENEDPEKPGDGEKDKESVQNFIDAVNALPDPSEVKKSDKEKVGDARLLYEKLKPEQKELVKDYLATLEDVEKAIKNLFNESEKTENDEIPQHRGTPSLPSSSSSGGSGGSSKAETKKDVLKPEDNKTKADANVNVEKEVVESKKEADSKGIVISGYPDGSFHPDAALTRGEMASLLSKLIPVKDISGNFTDISKDAWYREAALILKNAGILKGYPDGSFRGKNKITRAEFVTIICKWKNVSGIDSKFSDVPSSHWAAKAISIATEKGWVKGIDATHFAPEREITRAEAVVIFNRIMNHKKMDISMAQNFIDVPLDHWAYGDIILATNN